MWIAKAISLLYSIVELGKQLIAYLTRRALVKKKEEISENTTEFIEAKDKDAKRKALKNLER